MAFPEDLLEQAHHLAKREPKRPRQASLRRAVATAYYALFHLLITETTRNWKRAAERNTLARMFEHTQMGRVCQAKRNELRAYINSKPPAGKALETARHLELITDTFVQIQQDRHTADYDNSVKWSRTDAREKIEAVEEAFKSWRLVAKEAEAQNFLVTLLIKDRR